MYVKFLRCFFDLTQRDMGALLGVSVGRIGALEKGAPLRVEELMNLLVQVGDIPPEAMTPRISLNLEGDMSESSRRRVKRILQSSVGNQRSC